MPCYSPLKGYRSKDRNESGKRSIVFNARHGFIDQPIDVPCGQCIGCRLERSRQWAIRCFHEAQLHQDNAFITLTYTPENLPANGSLVKKHFQLFMKRLRKHVDEEFWGKWREDWRGFKIKDRPKPPRLRYFHCGEYGEKFERPHYHACLFGYNFPDRVIIRDNGETRLYSSEILREIWGKGHVSIGDVTFESAAYVARYITKKVTGEHAEGFYAGRLPEYTTMSRRPGIGSGWLTKYTRDVYPKDHVVVRGRPVKPAKFYDKMLEKTQPELLEKIKARRKKKAFDNRHDNTYDRVRAKQLCAELNLKQLKRSYEHDDKGIRSLRSEGGSLPNSVLREQQGSRNQILHGRGK